MFDMSRAGGDLSAPMKMIKPPESVENRDDWPTVFLAGSIEMDRAAPWQDYLSNALQDLPVLILNPRRDSWDRSWEQRIRNPHFKEQVDWELDGQDNSTFIAMHFDPGTKSPITLLELGLYAASGRMLVSCPDGFWRKGNVEIVCDRYNIPLFASIEAMLVELRTRLSFVLSEAKDTNKNLKSF